MSVFEELVDQVQAWNRSSDYGRSRALTLRNGEFDTLIEELRGRGTVASEALLAGMPRRISILGVNVVREDAPA